jgi:hypothetical protein
MPEQKQKSAFRGGGGDFDSDLSVTHEIKVPSIDDILASVRAALSSAQRTIDEQSGGECGCF